MIVCVCPVYKQGWYFTLRLLLSPVKPYNFKIWMEPTEALFVMENASRTFADPHLNINLAHPLDLASSLSDGDPSSDHFLSSEDKLRFCAVDKFRSQFRKNKHKTNSLLSVIQWALYV